MKYIFQITYTVETEFYGDTLMNKVSKLYNEGKYKEIEEILNEEGFFQNQYYNEEGIINPELKP